jgi:hypothetical protein
MRRLRVLVALVLLSTTFSLGRTEQDRPSPPPAPSHDPFTLYSPDPGAVVWADMSEDERANTNRTKEWAETRNGADVHSAFAAAAGRMNQLRLFEEAQATSNLEGIETLGVVHQ